jgi:hypothetical protein
MSFFKSSSPIPKPQGIPCPTATWDWYGRRGLLVGPERLSSVPHPNHFFTQKSWIHKKSWLLLDTKKSKLDVYLGWERVPIVNHGLRLHHIKAPALLGAVNLRTQHSGSCWCLTAEFGSVMMTFGFGFCRRKEWTASHKFVWLSNQS